MTEISYLNTDEMKGELWEVLTGCSGKGCATKDTCWAKDMVENRFPRIHGWDPDTEDGILRGYSPLEFSKVQFHPDRLNQPLHWKKPRRIGVCFLGDWMDDQVKPIWIDQMLEVIAACPQHQFFTLTKQPQNFESKIYGFDEEVPARELGGGDYLPNLWNGVSCCTQADVDRMVPDLLRIPGKHWISLEPCIDPIYFNFTARAWCDHHAKMLLDFVILGCHNNPKRYPFQLEWAESIIGQCLQAGVKLYIKQIPIANKCNRNPEDWPEHLKVREMV